MASTASDLIKFEKMATGEKSGTWGTLANVAMSRIEESIAGFRAITLAGSTYVLDDTQYLENSTTTSESHLAMIKAVGTPGASRQITVPQRTKLYLFWNTVTTYDMTVAAASGDSITVTNGNLAWVFCDGTNVEFASPIFTTAGIINASALPAASLTAVGGIEVATVAETNTGSDATRAVSPDGLDGWTGSAQVATVGTITSGAWTGTDVAVAAGGTGSSTASGARTNLGLVIGTDVLDEDDTSIGLQTCYIPAKAMRPTSSNPCADITDVETTSGRPDLQVLDFDASSDEHAQFDVAFPKNWDAGTITFRVFWVSTATDTDGVSWALQGLSVPDNTTIDAAYGTAVVVDDANQGAVEEMLVTATSGAVTISNAADDCLTFFRIFRDVSDSNDTATEDARLIGVQIFFTTDAGSDS